MVVSKEYVAYQLRALICHREQWLTEQDLPLNTCMDGWQKTAFMKDSKVQFHQRPEQQMWQADDAEEGKNVFDGKKHRWHRHQQICGGTTQMWSILSFKGCWQPNFLKKLPPVTLAPHTPEQQALFKAAVQARAKVRQARALSRLRDVLGAHASKGKGKLTLAQRTLLHSFDNKSLQDEANAATFAAGSGRLKRRDGTFVDIGGSTGGYFRTVLYDWSAPDTSEFHF